MSELGPTICGCSSGSEMIRQTARSESTCKRTHPKPNWLPAPGGNFRMSMLLYVPQAGSPQRQVDAARGDAAAAKTSTSPNSIGVPVHLLDEHIF